MNNYIDQLTKSLLKKESLDQCTVQELKQLADDYPYFGAAQLLLAKKLQQDAPNEYAAQVAKTSLFFNNSFWLDQLLNDKGVAQVEEGEIEIENEAVDLNGGENESEIEVQDVKRMMEETETKATIPAIDEIKATTLEEIQEVELVMDESARIVDPSETLEQPALEVKAQAFPVNTELLFEPYHTVDYFASQGIRFKEEEKPTDKFGQQLKSFTEWLKTLKRLPVSEIVKTAEPIAEKKVEQMAEASLTDRDVITETMAEVWQKQGNTEKAIEIYNKLSLLEPSKSAYFAAKIDELRK